MTAPWPLRQAEGSEHPLFSGRDAGRRDHFSGGKMGNLISLSPGLNQGGHRADSCCWWKGIGDRARSNIQAPCSSGNPEGCRDQLCPRGACPQPLCGDTARDTDLEGQQVKGTRSCSTPSSTAPVPSQPPLVALCSQAPTCMNSDGAMRGFSLCSRFSQTFPRRDFIAN